MAKKEKYHKFALKLKVKLIKTIRKELLVRWFIFTNSNTIAPNIHEAEQRKNSLSYFTPKGAVNADVSK